MLPLTGPAGQLDPAEATQVHDFDVIAANPKPFIGYSDITALHVAIRQRTDLATLYGNGLVGMGDPETTAFTRERLLEVGGRGRADDRQDGEQAADDDGCAQHARRNRSYVLVRDASGRVDDVSLGHAVHTPVDRSAAGFISAGSDKRIAVAIEEAPRIVGRILVIDADQLDALVLRQLL